MLSFHAASIMFWMHRPTSNPVDPMTATTSWAQRTFHGA
jgi:hypothetical protein